MTSYMIKHSEWMPKSKKFPKLSGQDYQIWLFLKIGSVKIITFLGHLEWRNLFGPKSIVSSHEKLVFRSGVGFSFLFVLVDAIFKNRHIWQFCRETLGFLGSLALAYYAELTYKRTKPYIWFYPISHILTQCLSMLIGKKKSIEFHLSHCEIPRP